jgi:hypothetical protein
MKSLLLIIIPAALLIWLTPVDAEGKTFETDSYSVNVPNGCKTEDEQNRFTMDASFKCKNLGNAEGDIAFELEGAPYTGTDEDLPDQLMTVISDKWSDPKEVERGTDKYIINNATAPYIIATFEQEYTGLFGLPTKTEDWVYMVVGIKMGDDMLYAEYKNKETKFDKQLPIFEKVLDSIQVKEGANTAKVTCFDDEKVEALGKMIGKPIDCVPKSELNSTDTDTKTTKEDDGSTFTSQGDDLSKTRAICDTVTNQSAKDLCETLLN